MEIYFKSILAGGGAVASFLFGGWTMAIQALVVFVVIDFLTGFFASAKSGSLSSRIGSRGIMKKVMIFLIVSLSHMVDQMLGDAHVIRDATITFYLANEGLSILENSEKMGLPVPDVVKQAIEILKGKDKEKDNNAN
jgi:toxin secretion/phage lysis holin